MREQTIQRIRELRELLLPPYYEEDSHAELDNDLFEQLNSLGFMVKLKGFGRDGLAPDIFQAIAKHGATAVERAFVRDEGNIEFWEIYEDECRRLLTSKAEILNRKLLVEPGYKGIPVLRMNSSMGFGVSMWRPLADEALWLRAWASGVSETEQERSKRVMLQANDEEWRYIMQQAFLKNQSLNDFLMEKVLAND